MGGGWVLPCTQPLQDPSGNRTSMFAVCRRGSEESGKLCVNSFALLGTAEAGVVAAPSSQRRYGCVSAVLVLVTLYLQLKLQPRPCSVLVAPFLVETSTPSSRCACILVHTKCTAPSWFGFHNAVLAPSSLTTGSIRPFSA